MFEPTLTIRQREVLQARADGHYNKTIAKDLWLDEETIKHHLEEARRRLGARNTTHAVAIAWRQGLIT